MIWNVPNILTVLRLLAAPAVAVMFLYFTRPYADWFALILFVTAAVTDWFDGYLARKLKQSSAFGAFLDPVADKLIVATALIMITHTYQTLWITMPAIILLSREVYVSSLREWMGQMGLSSNVKVSFIGKCKTTAQMLALIGLLSGMEYFLDFRITLMLSLMV